MKTIHAAALIPLFLVACATDVGKAPPPQGAAVVPQRQHYSTASAVRVPGDVVPSRLTAVALPAPTEKATITLSDPASPKEPLDFTRVAVPSTRTDYRRVVQATDAKSLSFPIDAPSGARVLIHVKDTTRSLHTVHLRDKSGALLDRARDRETSAPRFHREAVLTPKQKGLAGAAPAAPVGAAPLAAPSANDAQFDGALPSRILSIDVPTNPGRVQLQLPADAVAGGVIVEVQQPESKLTLSGAARSLQYAFGDEAEVSFTLANDGHAIDGASFSGRVELPNGEMVDGVSFTAAGNGEYVARVPLASADLKYIGTWHVHAKATGAVDGVEFERDLAAAFSYAPVHARMNDVHAPVIVRGADGMIDDITVDVEIETVVPDRLGLRAVLAYTDADGNEHAIAESQTGQTFDAGSGVMTLHFQAKDVALSKVDGPFKVRELALVSYAFATTQHRLGRGLDIVTPSISATQIRYPAEISPAAQELIDLGAL